ncbi:MAG: response regulator [Rhodomicrobium sp.]
MSRILVVDDEPMITLLLGGWLDELGHEMAGPTHNAASALALIEASPPDAAIVDVSLGAETGYPVAESLAKRNIPFVFATGHSATDLPPGFAGRNVLTKPFDFACVRAAVSELIGEIVKKS